MTLPRCCRPPLAALALLPLVAIVAACGPERTGPQTVPGEETVFAISAIRITHAKHEPGESLPLALEVMNEIRGGAPVAEVARRVSDVPRMAERGGWLGFMEPQGEGILSVVMQALPIGQVSGPVVGPEGFSVFYRHTMAEGRRLEQERVIPVYGFTIPWAEQPGSPFPEKKQAKARAEEALRAIRDGELDLIEAKTRFSPRAEGGMRAFLALAELGTETEAMYRGVEKLATGELAPVVELPGAYGILLRGTYLRSLVRHILIRHAEGPSQGADAPVDRSRDEARQIAEDVLAKMKPDRSNWDELLQEYSDEEMTIPMGGLIGCVSNGFLIPVLEEAVLATPPGRVLDRIVESPGAFHVIWRMN